MINTNIYPTNTYPTNARDVLLTLRANLGHLDKDIVSFLRKKIKMAQLQTALTEMEQ